MPFCKRTDAADKDFLRFITLLDADLNVRNGTEQSFFTQFNKPDAIKHVIVAYDGDDAAGCGAVKEYAAGIMEIKRMFTLPEKRGRGIASAVLTALEDWSKEMGYNRCILETGKKQVEAIALYTKKGYSVISNYGQYAGVESSVCFEKIL